MKKPKLITRYKVLRLDDVEDAYNRWYTGEDFETEEGALAEYVEQAAVDLRSYGCIDPVPFIIQEVPDFFLEKSSSPACSSSVGRFDGLSLSTSCC